MKACGDKHRWIYVSLIGLLLLGLGGVVELVDARVTRAIEPVRKLESTQSGISATLKSIDGRIERIEDILQPKGNYNATTNHLLNPLSRASDGPDCWLHGQPDFVADH